MAALIPSAQTVTASWADLGAEQDVSKYRRTGIWVNLDINSSNNVRLRALAKLGSGATLEFAPVIKTTGASDIGIVGGYYEFTADSDQQAYFEVELNGLVPIIQWQVIAGTLGVTAAIITSADVTYSMA